MEVHGDAVVLDHYSFPDPEDVSDLPIAKSSFHELLDPCVMTDVATNGREEMLGLPGDVGFILPTLMQRADQSLVCGVASLVVVVPA